MTVERMECLGNLCKFLNGGTPSKQAPEYYKGNIPWITGTDIDGPIICLARSFITEQAIKESATNFVPKGSLLLVTRTSVGKVALAGMDLCFSQDITAIMPDKVRLDKLYLFHFLTGKQEYFAQRQRGATIKGITREVLTEMVIPLPPLEEQKRLAALLDEADALRRKRSETSGRLAFLLRSTFLEMFGNFDMFPKAHLRDVCAFITKGTTPKSSELHLRKFDDAVPFLKVYNIADDGGLTFEARPAFISFNYHKKELARSKVLPGDVLMNIVGPPLGKIGIVPNTYPEWNINQAIAIFRPEKNLNSWYLLHALRSPRILPGILKQAVGIRQLNLSLEQCRSITIPLPPLQLQQEFEKKVIEINMLREQSQESWKRLGILFATLQHQAFGYEPTGSIASKPPTSPCLTLDF